MSDPVKTPSDNPNQPAVETPAAAPAATAVPTDPAPATPAAPAATTDTPAAPAAAVTPPETPAEPAAPAEIKYDIQLPKAMTDAGHTLDPTLLPALTPALKQAGLTQQQLQTVAESFLTYQQGLPKMLLDRDLAVVMKDPEIGGFHYGQTNARVQLAISRFGGVDFGKTLERVGLANNLEFVRVFERIGQALEGDTPARGSPDGGAPELSRAERMYGRTKPT